MSLLAKSIAQQSTEFDFSDPNACQESDNFLSANGNNVQALDFNDVHLGEQMVITSLLYHLSGNLTCLKFNFVHQSPVMWSLLTRAFGRNLEEFALQGVVMNENEVSGLVQHLQPKCLRRLSVHVSSLSSLHTLCNKFTQLTHLKCRTSANPDVSFCDVCPQLEQLDIAIDEEIYDLAWLSHRYSNAIVCPSLKSLRIEGLINIDPQCLDVFHRFVSLQHLQMTTRTEEQLAACLSCTPKLVSLSARTLSPVQGTSTAMHFINKMRQLESLSMDWPVVPFDKSTYWRFRSMPWVRHLTLNTFNLRDRQPEHVNEMFSCLPGIFPNLQTLDLTPAHSISAAQFSLKKLTSLQFVRILTSKSNVAEMSEFLSSHLGQGNFICQSCCEDPDDVGF